MTKPNTSQTTPLIEGFTLGPFATNCFIVQDPDTHDAWIVDAGYEPAPMIQRAKELNLNIKAVILTHAHADHIGGLAEVLSAFPDIPVMIHDAESEFPGDPTLNLSAAYGTPLHAPTPDTHINHNQTLTLGQTSWKVLHTPGHSPGGITLYNDAGHIALVGDTLFAGSIGRHDFPTSNQSDLVSSIKDKLYTLPEDTRVYPGHGPATTIAVEKTTNPFVRADS